MQGTEEFVEVDAGLVELALQAIDNAQAPLLNVKLFLEVGDLALALVEQCLLLAQLRSHDAEAGLELAPTRLGRFELALQSGLFVEAQAKLLSELLNLASPQVVSCLGFVEACVELGKLLVALVEALAKLLQACPEGSTFRDIDRGPVFTGFLGRLWDT